MASTDRILDALGDPTRRVVFRRVRERSRCVNEIAAGLKVSRPAVSQHLRVLKDAGLVIVRAEGNRHVYAVHTRGIETLRDWLDGLWDEALAAFKSAAELEAARFGKT